MVLGKNGHACRSEQSGGNHHLAILQTVQHQLNGNDCSEGTVYGAIRCKSNEFMDSLSSHTSSGHLHYWEVFSFEILSVLWRKPLFLYNEGKPIHSTRVIGREESHSSKDRENDVVGNTAWISPSVRHPWKWPIQPTARRVWRIAWKEHPLWSCKSFHKWDLDLLMFVCKIGCCFLPTYTTNLIHFSPHSWNDEGIQKFKTTSSDQSVYWQMLGKKVQQHM